MFEGNGWLVLKEHPTPSLKRDTGALIKVTGVGIYGTDLHILQVPPAHPTKFGIILGHEFTGEILEVGSQVEHLKPEMNVTGDCVMACGIHRNCKDGLMPSR